MVSCSYPHRVSVMFLASQFARHPAAGERQARATSRSDFDGRTMQSTPESGEHAGYDGHKKTKGSKIHLAGGKLAYLLALHVTPALKFLSSWGSSK